MDRATALPSLADAEFLRRPETRRVMAALNGNGTLTRAVGGAVRDALLGRPVRDVDLATTAKPAEVTRCAKSAGFSVVPTGLGHGTVTVIADRATFQVTTLRTDVETFGRRAKVAFGAGWEADARRRDFTMNALYASAEGDVFDPLRGYDDLKRRRLRFIGDADARIAEDYLRILRLFRLYAEIDGATLDAGGVTACVRGRAGMRQLSAERLRAELTRLLAAPRALLSIEAMFECGLLTQLLGQAPRVPDFARLIAIEASLEWPPDAMLRLAALALYTEEDVARLTRRFTLSNKERRVLKDAARANVLALKPSEAGARRSLYRLGPQAWRRGVLMRWMRARAAAEDSVWHRLANLPNRWTAPPFPLSGHDLMQAGLSPGPEIGIMLRHLEEAWIESDFSLGREDLLKQIG